MEGRGGQGGGHFLAEAGFVGAAGGPEEAGVALAVRGGADEAEQGRGRVGVWGRGGQGGRVVESVGVRVGW